MTRYSEAKSVKVDNWGVFFLQKLQNFFNKTDHCDLTLQFNDNSQLKVHRLVLSACTDYFNHLENVCEMYDDVLIMPMDLQADVIVPIVNFMYTGTLEFQYSMYERLLKTATDMNMTVLLKLLEAHRQTSRISKQPVLLNKQAPRMALPTARPPNAYVATAPRAAGAPKAVVRQAVVRPGHSKGSPESSSLVAKYGHAKDSKSGPSRFDDTQLSEGFEGSFDAISYESKPLLTADQLKKEEETSPFEKLRKGYTNTNVAKRASAGSITSPPAKKPNLEEVKEFTEAARLRSQLNTDDDDDPDYVDDDTHFNDDDDDDYQPPASLKSSMARAQTGKQIVVKQETKSPNATGSGSMKQITVKDESGNVDHAKIISEVLKKYPHLVKQNKNIKLKIMQKVPPGSSQAAAGAQGGGSKVEIRTATPLKQDISMVRKATASIRSEQQQKVASTASGSAAAAGNSNSSSGKSAAATATATATKPNPPKTIDAKTMHALIAKGAENMTGPWLCLRCGVNGRPISIPSYKAFRNHLIVKHKERIDTRICEHCGWRAETRNPHLIYHWLVEHGIKSPVKFPSCTECDHIAMNNATLKQHMEKMHQQERQHCIYCNEVFEKELDLYCHMKDQHRERARSDGVLDFSEDEDDFQDQRDESPPTNRPSEGKIKILSNITLPTKGSALPFVIGTTQPVAVSQISGKTSSEAEALSNVASGIATSLRLVGDGGVVIDDPNYQNEFIEAELASVHGENAATVSAENSGSGGNIITKLLSEDGTELQLTPSQREDIISQLQINSANVVMMDEVKFADGSTVEINDGVQIVNSAHADGASNSGNQNIMLVYSDSATDGGTEGCKTISNDDVAPSEDDENAQVSAAMSEKASSSTDKPADEESTIVPEEEESQESCKTDRTGKEPNEGEDAFEDVDMLSADNSLETNETNKPTIKSGTRNDKKNEKHKEEREDAEEERHKSDKLKLISELEGDWSEDTEEQSTTTVPTAPTANAENKRSVNESATEKISNKKVASIAEKKSVPEKMLVVGTSSSKKLSTEKDKKKEDKPNVSNPSKKAVASRNPDGKEIDKLLDEWNNEPSKLEDSDTEVKLGKKSPEAAGLLKSENGKIKQEDEIQKKNDDDTEAMETDELRDAPASKSSAVEIVSKISTSKTETDNSTTAKKTVLCNESISANKLEDVKVEAEEDEDQDEDDKEKASKTKDVSSLLGEWDEDDEL